MSGNDINVYNNIKLTNNIDEANCITHSGKFHVDEVISTIFLSKLKEKVILLRTPSINNSNIEGKIVFDIGLGEFDHHQEKRNGIRKNGIYYSSIGLLWKKFGMEYLKKLKLKNKTEIFTYIDQELIQYIDAADNIQKEYYTNNILPDFIKLCNPEWNDNLPEEKAFINALELADKFWNMYFKHAIAEVEAIDIIKNKIKESKENYIIFENEIPYKRIIKYNNTHVEYIIQKSRRCGYEVRIMKEHLKFNEDIYNIFREYGDISDIIYIDNLGKLICTKTIESAIKIIKANKN